MPPDHPTIAVNGPPDGASQPPAVHSEGRKVLVDGINWHCLVAGSGPPLLLVHGLMGYSFSWRHAVPAFARQRTVFAVDLPGTGYSDRSPGMDCSMRASATRLLRFMDTVGISACDLLGTSHGGAVAMMAAAEVPTRIRRLILVAPVNPWSARGKGLSLLFTSPLIAPFFPRIMQRAEILHDFYFRRLFGDTRRIQPGALDGYRAPARQPGSFEYALEVLRSWNRDLKELKSLFPRIADVPTLLMWGSLDAAVDPASAYPLKRCFRNSRLILMEGIGHLPYEEVPQEFNRIVTEFLMQAAPRG